ncbi:hypothetical protein CCHL11_08781 [Colletotrichum chlorophyti]|uniref:Alpha-L-rhamnosidase six-hairpin glycosidase domain-containing protein n=1 Tax=Colletotrichum chlorophyti TaxID=708187 RepID=A0A1Q8REH8_9PEZI|nr:hypothetical protein CCHL11_08781 [Colletotrichum chlorophyti]
MRLSFSDIFALMTGQWSLLSSVWKGESPRSPVADDISWHRYVRASASRTIRPVRVISDLTRGAVRNPSGLISGEGGPTVLTRPQESDDVPSVTVDFGQNTVGILSISFSGSSSGDGGGRPGVRLSFSETLQFLSSVSDFSRSYNGDSITPGSDQIAVRGGSYAWTAKHGCEVRDGDRGKVCVDGLHGFRYVRISLDAIPSDAPYAVPYGEVGIANVTLSLSAFHGTAETFGGWFECSDKEVTQWWFDGVYTNDLCIDEFRGREDAEPRGAGSETLEGKVVIHDAPKRDRDPYVGDLAVAAVTGYVSHGGLVAEAAGNVLADLAVHQRADGWIPPASINNYTLPLFDYPLWWVVCSHDYVWYTGDLDYLESYYANLVAVLDKWYTSVTDLKTKLVTKGLRGTGGYGDYAFLPRHGPVTYYNALYVLALRRAAEMAAEIGEAGDAGRWRRRAEEVSEALEARNFDKRIGAFYDGTREGTGEFVKTHAQDGNSIAVLADVVSGERARGILEYYGRASSHPYGNAFYDSDAVGQGFSQRVYAFVSYFEMAARFKAGMGESAVEEMKRLYGWMGGHDPGVTFWEGIGVGGRPYEDGYTSMAHGWSTGVVPVLSGHVLGIRPTSPGFGNWSVTPSIGGFGWARGAVPTPKGEGVEVDWEDRGEKGFRIVVKAPKGTGGVIGVPVRGREAVVEVSGVVVYDGRDGTRGRFDEGRVLVDVEGKGVGEEIVVLVRWAPDSL